jgi:hypothetical protein
VKDCGLVPCANELCYDGAPLAPASIESSQDTRRSKESCRRSGRVSRRQLRELPTDENELEVGCRLPCLVCHQPSLIGALAFLEFPGSNVRKAVRKAEGCASSFPGKREVENELRELRVEGRGSRIEGRGSRVKSRARAL